MQGLKIGTITMENYRMRKIIDGLDGLIEIFVVNEPDEVDRKQKWKQALVHYRTAMQIMKKR